MSNSKKRTRTRKRKSNKSPEDEELVIKRENSSSHLSTDDTLIPTGLTELNCIVSGNAFGGIPAGGQVHVVGDSDAGKTILVVTALAEIAADDRFDDYRLIYLPTEGGFSFNVEYLFGSALAERLEVIEFDPYTVSVGSKKKKYEMHNTVEQWYQAICTMMKESKCAIITDSLDGLTCEDWEVAEIKKEDGDDAGGSMGMEKAKAFHKGLRKIRRDARASGGVHFYLSQVKDKSVDFGFANVKYSGGKALKHYADLQIAISVGGPATYRTLKGEKHKVSSLTKVKVLKNHINGKNGEILFRIVHNYGIDDLYGCVDYLNRFRWTGLKTAETPKEIGCDLPLNKKAKEAEKQKQILEVVDWIEDNRKMKKVRRLVQNTFHDVEEELTPKRKRRF